MTVYVDELRLYPVRYTRGQLVPTPAEERRGSYWCHLVTDGDVSELHALAKAIGLRREWFQNKPDFPHYDLTPHMRRLAMEAGAQFKKSRDIIREIVWPRRQRIMAGRQR